MAAVEDHPGGVQLNTQYCGSVGCTGGTGVNGVRVIRLNMPVHKGGTAEKSNPSLGGGFFYFTFRKHNF